MLRMKKKKKKDSQLWLNLVKLDDITDKHLSSALKIAVEVFLARF